MFERILIANRGEIACRVARTARRLGVGTVAVYSDADARALHVEACDQAFRIGAAPPRESYLNGTAIIDVAKQSGAQAIHPGYGFLSENEAFAAACARAGLVFVGPPPAAIAAMGSKSAAKAIMASAGVPVVPGYHGDDQDPALLAREAAGVGYPVLIKAVSGGGGKGMKVAQSASEFAPALASAQREGQASFGDARVLLERYLSSPRHIEIQVFADTHGNAIHLFERDCSVQRRHQKVLEEAPAPGMDEGRRRAMGEAAVAAAKAIGYVGAGTVEFIAEQDGAFYFMEMNTRLQVEHPVTEMITGVDLVEWQLRVAAGEPLPKAQEQLAISGHAIEARIYAEDPDRGFLPSTGRLVHLAPPPESASVRVDTGVEEGDAITPFYDPMIAKLIVHGADRAAALARMRDALARYRIVGVANNVEFLGRLVATPSFANADLDTALIEREHDRLFPAESPPPDDAWLVAALAEVERDAEAARRAAASAPDPASPWRALDGWRLNGSALRRLGFRHGETMREVDAAPVAGGTWQLVLDGTTTTASARASADGAIAATLGERRFPAAVVANGDRRHVFVAGRAHALALVDLFGVSGAEHDEEGAGLVAPMPGKVIALLAAPGAAVEKGAPLLVLEAMKMEHTISAPRAGTVKAFRVAAGEQVSEGAELVDFE
jgi:3-methylcrotonyl-CoA carboxylase alpha subunit